MNSRQLDHEIGLIIDTLYELDDIVDKYKTKIKQLQSKIENDLCKLQKKIEKELD